MGHFPLKGVRVKNIIIAILLLYFQFASRLRYLSRASSCGAAQQDEGSSRSVSLPQKIFNIYVFPVFQNEGRQSIARQNGNLSVWSRSLSFPPLLGVLLFRWSKPHILITTGSESAANSLVSALTSNSSLGQDLGPRARVFIDTMKEVEMFYE